MEIRFVACIDHCGLLGHIAIGVENDLKGDGPNYLNVVSIFICSSIYVFLVVDQKTISDI